MSAALALRALVVFALSRLVCVAALASQPGGSLAGAVRSFDGFWYQLVAVHGYPQVLQVDRHGLFTRSGIAFFPAFPLLVRPFTQAGAPFWAAALAVNTVLGAVAAVLLAALARRHTGSDQAALVTAALWSILPATFVLSLAYSEALFVALCAGCLLALAYDRWLVAGLLAALAGATRPTGVAVMVACGVAAIAAALRRGVPWHRRLTPFLAPLLAPWGALAYAAFLGRRYGRPSVWSDVERDGWHTRVDWAASAYHRVTTTLSGHAPARTWLYVAVVILAALVLLLVALVERLPAAQVAYCAVVIALALASRGVYSSVPRMLLPAFPLLIPVGRWLARLPWAVGAWVWLAALPTLAFATAVLLSQPGFAP